MSEQANNGSPSPISLVLEIREKKPVLKFVTFQEQDKRPVSFTPRNGFQIKAIATVLTLFRAHPTCVFFRITSKKEGKNLVQQVVGAVRERLNNPAAQKGDKGKLYNFANGQFLNLFLVPSNDKDFSYVELDFKRLKPSAITIKRNNQNVEATADLQKLAEQIATA